MTALDMSAAPTAWAPPTIAGIDEVAASVAAAATAAVSATTAVPPTARARTLAAGPRATPTLARRRQWERYYRYRLTATDALIVVVTTVAAALVPLGIAMLTTVLADPWSLVPVPLSTAVIWLLSLALLQTRDARVTGSGSTEYKRVVHATGLAFGVLAIAFVIFQWNGLRSQLILTLPLGLVALLAARWSWRRWLVGQRQNGLYRSRAIVVGRRRDVAHVVETLERDGQLGYHVVGTSLDDDTAAELSIASHTYPTVGDPADVARAARRLGADTIVVASHIEDPDYVRRLGWELEGAAADLVLSSRLTDVAGPRISLQQVRGLPLIQVRIPTFDGGQHIIKRGLDIVVATLALLPIALITPVIALLIKLDSPGEVFFRQRRIGQDGREFDILKFRTMRVNADAELSDLAATNDGAGLLFKMRRDPRVTKVGAVLRKFSLDELPQFWNVLRGEMSVVGPRPPLPSEVGGYHGAVFRRLYIKPGITGLWQVSGRSDLSWEESVRLDLHYVENWSLMSDLLIICRTAKVMLRGTGAY